MASFFKFRGEWTHDGFMHSKPKIAIRIQVVIEQIKDFILKVVIEIDDDVPAND